MESIDLQSVIGLTIQSAGIVLITTLSLFMTRSIRSTALNYWAAAWVFLTIALISLAIGFRVSSSKDIFFTIYLLGEYLFGFLLIAGCRNRAEGALLTISYLYWLIPGAVIAMALPQLLEGFNVLFIPQAAIMASLFAASFYFLRPAWRKEKAGPGIRVMSVALMLLAIDFLHYVPIMTYAEITGQPNLSYLKFTSIYDLIFEILLGFGTLMVVMDDVRHKVEAANRELVAARDRLETLARMDPLTDALNRHGFNSLLKKNRQDQANPMSGCAVVIDIDDLKLINDSFGHPAGDAVIREVASAIRSVIRADDLLFRWGGDEFLILMFNVSEADVHNRISELDSILAHTILSYMPEPFTIIVSQGTASFKGKEQIEIAIEEADLRMYARKQGRKAQRTTNSGRLVMAKELLPQM